MMKYGRTLLRVVIWLFLASVVAVTAFLLFGIYVASDRYIGP